MDPEQRRWQPAHDRAEMHDPETTMPSASDDETRYDEPDDLTAVHPGEEFPSFWEAPPPEPEIHEPVKRSRGVALFLAALLGAGVGTGGTYLALHNTVGTGAGVKVLSSAPVAQITPEAGNPVAAVAAAVLPSIVQIDVTTVNGEQGTGSGVIYRQDGYIITNNHVVEGADSLTVTLATGEKLPAALTGSAAPNIDIAVIKVTRTGLPAATFGSTKDLHVGDLAVAIGSPFRLTASVTAGVISAMHRNEIPGAGERLTDDIQTDAPINPGNSGGALANSKGAVIGINQAIAGGTGGNVGIGFAIPVDLVIRVADELIATGKVTLPYLGVTGGDQASGGAGALIDTVRAGGPADRAGIKPGDLIVQLNDSQISSFNDLISFIIQQKVGDIVKIVAIRDGKRQNFTATLAQRPAE